LPFSAYPPSLLEDIDCFARQMASAGCFSLPGRKRPMRPATWRKSIRQVAWALVANGRDPGGITGLNCLVSPEVVETILTCYWGRKRGHRPAEEDDESRRYSNGNTMQLQGIGITLAVIAKHHCNIEPGQLKRVRELAATARVPPRDKPTAKNHERLRQFDDLRMRADLMSLPRLLMDEATDAPSRRGSRARRSSSESFAAFPCASATCVRSVSARTSSFSAARMTLCC
jgi:hypothetical protein